jgi:hypothetical protein
VGIRIRAFALVGLILASAAITIVLFMQAAH